MMKPSTQDPATLAADRRLADSYDNTGKAGRFAATLIVLAIATFALFLANLCIGSVEIPPLEALQALAAGPSQGMSSQIIWEIRLPRIISCIVLGAALALSGFLLQTFFNNPIASPYTLGVSSGAKFVVALVMIVLLGSNQAMPSWMMVIAAFVGALAVMGFILIVAQRVSSMATLIIAGVMVGYACGAATDFLITFADDQNIVNLQNWSLGSFSGANWNDVAVMCAVCLPASLAVFLLSKPISAFQLGESYAKSMGVNIRAFRVALIMLSSLLAACVTAFAGPISFVGIAVPHLVKAGLKSSKPIRVLPASFLGGAIFCLVCDLIARSIFSPTEVTISAVTALFGAPVVIYILMKREKTR